MNARHRTRTVVPSTASQPSPHPYRTPPPSLPAPSRHVPLGLWIRLMFGGWLPLFGWAFFALGSFFCWMTVPRLDFGSGISDGQRQEASAEVTGVESAHIEVNDQKISAVDFRFVVDGRTVSGRSYTAHPPAVGERVAAEFSRRHPERACLRGMTHRPLPIWAGFVVVFPLVGGVFLLLGLRGGLRAGRLLRDGRLTRGKLVGKRETNVRINEQPVYELRFEFEVDAVKYEAVAKTHVPRVLEDEPTEQIVYLERDPQQATLLDHLPGAPEVRDDESIIATYPALSFALLLLPAAAILAHAIGAWVALR